MFFLLSESNACLTFDLMKFISFCIVDAMSFNIFHLNIRPDLNEYFDEIHSKLIELKAEISTNVY